MIDCSSALQAQGASHGAGTQGGQRPVLTGQMANDGPRYSTFGFVISVRGVWLLVCHGRAGWLDLVGKGWRVRFRLGNAFGSKPLRLSSSRRRDRFDDAYS